MDVDYCLALVEMQLPKYLQKDSLTQPVSHRVQNEGKGEGNTGTSALSNSLQSASPVEGVKAHQSADESSS